MSSPKSLRTAARSASRSTTAWWAVIPPVDPEPAPEPVEPRPAPPLPSPLPNPTPEPPMPIDRVGRGPVADAVVPVGTGGIPEV